MILTPAADLYGSDRSLLKLLPRLVVEYRPVLVSAAEGPMLDQARRLGVEVHVTEDWALRRRMLRLTALPGAAAHVRSTLALVRRLHRQDPFVGIYANTVANALLPFLGRAVPVPLVVHVREVPRDEGRLSRLLFGTVDRSADLVLCNSAFTAAQVTEMAPGLSDRLAVVHNGIAAPGPDEAVGTRWDRRPDDALQVVCVGRIHPKKGQWVLVEAARLAVEQGLDLHLHFFGEALPEHADLFDEIRGLVDASGLASAVTWHGYEGDTGRLYSGMDVAVVPSVLPEEFSLVTAEAQVRGLPVIATGPGGPSEIIEDGVTGRIVAPDDARALADALVEVADPARGTAWGRAGRTRTLERFTLERYVDGVATHLAGLFERTGEIVAVSPATDLYGSDRALLGALPALLDRRPVTLVVPDDGPLVGIARDLGCEVRIVGDFAIRRRDLTPVGVVPTMARSWGLVRELRRLADHRSVDLVYVNTAAVPATPLLGRAARAPMLVHIHERAQRPTEQRVLNWLTQRFTDLVVTNSAWTAGWIERPASDVRVEVVHNGVELPDRPADLRTRTAAGPFVIACVARLHPKKGQWVLLDALAQLVADGVDASVLLVGDARPEHAELEQRLHEQVVAAGLTDRVVFVGYQPDPTPWYAEADVAVVPSVFPEEFSLVAAEAQALGLPVVATGPGGVSEVVLHETTGLIVPAGDPDALARALARLAGEPELARRFGSAGAVRSRELFGIDAYRERLGAAVDSVLDGGT